MNAREHHLVRRSLLGDRDAFGELVRMHQSTVMAAVVKWTSRLEDAEDITQEVFILAYLQLHTLRDPSKFLSWIRTIASNLCFHLKERNRRTTASEQRADGALEGGASPDPEEVYAGHQPDL